MIELSRSILNLNQKLSELRGWLLRISTNRQFSFVEAEEKLGMVAEENPKYGEI